MTPKNQKIALGVAAVGLLGYFAFFHGTISGNGVDQTGNGGTGTNGNGSTFNAFDAVQRLYDAMKETGTDEDAVLAVLTRLTPAQFDQVFVRFGSLKYNPLLGNQYGILTLDRYDLKGWLKNEISLSEYNVYKRKFPNRL